MSNCNTPDYHNTENRDVVVNFVDGRDPYSDILVLSRLDRLFLLFNANILIINN